MFILHLTVERLELRVVEHIKQNGEGQESEAFERKMRWLSRAGFVILTVVLIVMIYSAQPI